MSACPRTKNSRGRWPATRILETVWVDVSDNAVIDDIPNKPGVPLVGGLLPRHDIVWIRCVMPGAAREPDPRDDPRFRPVDPGHLGAAGARGLGRWLVNDLADDVLGARSHSLVITVRTMKEETEKWQSPPVRAEPE